MAAARISRNDPCPCGSGKKYKRCCEEKDAAKPQKSGAFTFTILALLIAGGAVALVFSLARGKTDPNAGRVWSAEHGHWHDAPSSGQSQRRFALGQTPAPGLTPRAAPPGTPPPGKVWSEEHGHWHDAVQAGVTPGVPPPIPVTAAPQ